MIEFIEYNVFYLSDTLDLIMEFANEYKEVNGGQPNKAHIAKVLNMCKASIIVDDGKPVGILAGIISPQALDDELIFNEILFYVRKEYRKHTKDFYKYFEEVLYDKGIRTFVFGAVHNEKIELTDRMYKQMGYKPIETHYVKRLK